MKNLKYVSYLLMLLPMGAFANTTDNTFSEVYNTLSQYLTGSLGNVILMVCLLGVVIALAGFAHMKIMFPILVIAMVVRFGPAIITSLAATSAELSTNINTSIIANNGLTLTFVLLLVGAVVALSLKNQKLSKRIKNLEN